MPEAIEQAAALGGEAMKVWYEERRDKEGNVIQDLGRIRIGWAMADQFVPTQWDSAKVEGGIFVTRQARDGWYYRECPERRLFKSPEYHSTLTFDNKPPYEYLARWSFGPQKEGKLRGFYKLDGVFGADASHHGYDPDYHKRLCALVGKDVFLVADDVANITETDVRIYFHMDDPTVKIDGDMAKSDRIRVLLPEGVAAETVPSEKSTNGDIKQPSSRIILTDTAHKSRLYLTLFTKRDDVTDHKICRTTDGVVISYKQAGEEVKLLWSFTNSLKRL